MVLPKNIEITPSLEEIRSGARPEEIQITTYMDGPFGKMENTTVWTTQFNHHVEAFREDIIFQEGWFDTGKSTEALMPWEVSYSHMVNIRKIGGILFIKKRYAKVFLYGSRSIYDIWGDDGKVIYPGDKIWYFEAKDEKEEEFQVLLTDESEGQLWRLVEQLFNKNVLKDMTSSRLTAKHASERLRQQGVRLGPSRAIDYARENSLRLKYQLYRLIDVVARGDAARSLFKEREMRELTKIWTPKVWRVLSDENVPEVW
jgi:hypothetical protein